ncbi:MAG: Multidrug export protein MepA [Candidatus Izimaplasma bacterium HR2]|nr:MAG: Multidrug export protein MepA [Candidatus Izimaplasma bacterium HR2]
MTKEDNRRYLILKDSNIYKGLLILALPLMLNNFIRTIHDLVDMYFVKSIPGHATEAVNSIAVTFPVLFTFISLGMGLGIAGTALISQFVGSNQRDDARCYATNLFVIAVVVGIVLNIVMYFGSPYVMYWMGNDGFTLEKSSNYLQIRSFELTLLFIFFAFTAIKQSDGDTVTPVVYGVSTIIINIILTPIMILEDINIFGLSFSGLGYGVEGAAYATLIAHLIVMPFVLYQLFFSKTGLTISFKFHKFRRKISKQIMRTALPASSGQALTAIGFIIMTTIIISYGVDTLAAFSIGNRIASLILHPVMAIGGVVAAYIGQNIGNLNVERAKETFKKAMILSLVIMTVLSIIVMFLREPLAMIFLEESEAIDLTVKYMFYLIIGLPLMAIFQTFIGTFNGTGHTKFTFAIGVTRLWILRIPLILIFKYFTDMGSSGIWTAMLISNFIIAFVGYGMYKTLDFKPRIELRDN